MTQQIQDLIVFATWQNDKIILNPNAIKIFNNYITGKIYTICFQGFFAKYQFSRLLSHSRINFNNPQNCILMRSSPKYFPQDDKLTTNNQKAKQDLHLLASLISDFIVVAYQQHQPIGYLASINKRIQSIYSFKDNIQKKTGNLACIQAIESQKKYINKNTDRLFNRLKVQNRFQQIMQTYPFVIGYQSTKQTLKNKDYQFYSSFYTQIDSIQQGKNNTYMHYGKIYVKFIQNIVKQINDLSSVNIQKAQQIQIQKDYQAFIQAVKQFHQISMNDISLIGARKIQDNQIQNILQNAKKQSSKVFYKYGGGSNNQTRDMFNKYVQQKSQKVLRVYSQQTWNKNLQILQRQGKQALNKLNSNPNKNQQIIKTSLNQMINNYNHSAQGSQKYTILNEYMKVFTPIAFSINPQKLLYLKKQQQRNKLLQQQINKIKRKSCCSSNCQIF